MGTQTLAFRGIDQRSYHLTTAASGMVYAQVGSLKLPSYSKEPLKLKITGGILAKRNKVGVFKGRDRIGIRGLNHLTNLQDEKKNKNCN